MAHQPSDYELVETPGDSAALGRISPSREQPQSTDQTQRHPASDHQEGGETSEELFLITSTPSPYRLESDPTRTYPDAPWTPLPDPAETIATEARRHRQ